MFPYLPYLPRSSLLYILLFACPCHIRSLCTMQKDRPARPSSIVPCIPRLSLLARDRAQSPALLDSHRFHRFTSAGAAQILFREKKAPLYFEAKVPVPVDRWDDARFSAFHKELHRVSRILPSVHWQNPLNLSGHSKDSLHPHPLSNAYPCCLMDAGIK